MKKIYFFLILFLLNFFTLQSQTVDYIYSNFGGYWESGVGNLNTIKPNNHHELLAFRFSSTVYSTGVNNALLDTNGVTYANTTYKALPVQDGSFPTSSGSGGPLLFAIGSMWDGSTSTAQEPGPFTIPPLFSEMLNDGANGLDLGTAITNIPGSAAPLDFLLSSIPDLSMIADGIPDIVVSQLAQPSSTLDAIYFEDASGNLVGNVLTIDFSNGSNTPDLGTWAADFYDPNTGLSNGSSFVNSTRPIKLWARDASAFGINSSNYMNVARLRYDLGGTSDPAFIAYNSAFISVFEAVDDEVTTTYNTPVVIDVLENDTVALPVTVTISSPPSSGTVSIDPATNEIIYTPDPGFSGTVTFEYEVCQGATCDTATVTITVENEIQANDDTFTFDGNDTPSVLNNDTLNGSAVDPTEINITVVTNDPELTLNPDGTISVDPSATPGTYTLEYQICEVANPTNCDTATVTVTVENNIEANNDTFTFDGNDTTSVLNNDTLNGSAVDPTEINITVVTNDPELTLNPDGTISVDPSATPGTYTLEYQICEVANPTNCDTATVTVTVENNIEANNDTFTFDGNDTTSVLNNDTLNGSAVDPTEINITVVTNDPELTMNPDGTVSVDPSATPGTYTLEYQICEVANPTNCDTATVTITVENNIEANNDTFTFDGNDTTSVLNNDTLNGSAVDPTEINITVVTNDPELTLNPDGTVSVDPSATPGTYTLEYQICEVANPTNCDTATVTITVENEIQANDDTFTFDGNDTPSVLNNDTLNGSAVDPTEINITVVTNDPELTLNPDGTISVDPSATPGTYTLEYQICEVANPTNCDTATVTVTVENNIEANNDTFTFDGNDTPSVLNNDTLNGSAVDPTEINITVVTNDPELTLNPDGTISVDPSATPGTYTLEYQICEVANPTNCDTATVTVTVENNIEANNDTFTFDGNDTTSVLNNDTLNGSAVDPTEINITVVTNDPELTMNPDGTVSVDPSATPGTYTLEYQICEVANPTNCDTATVTITVENNIEANNDTFTFDGNDTTSVLNNDTLNGSAVDPTEINITVVTNDPELTLNPDGTVSVDPSATPGTYTLEYQICEVANPTNCDTATVTITVENEIQANDDTFTFDGNDTPSVLNNDTLNGSAVDPTEINITVVTNDPELTLNPDGTISVDPSATPGTYTLEYQICEVANPTNCDTATVTVTVENNIEANNDTFTFDGNDTPSVLNNDTLNGSAVDPTEINITVVTNDPELTLNPDGTISVDPSATPGTYTLEYQICEVANPTNCDTATVTVTVENNIEANNDTFTFDGNDTTSVLNNDTLNGSAVDPTEINITVVTNDPELTMNPDGTVSVDPSATPGTYTLEYQICEVANPTNCDTATVTITVENNIEANNDTFTFDGNDTTSVLNNDTLNGSAVDPTEINITVVTNDPELTLNPDGTVSVDPSATPGTYTLEYQICEVANPTNCDTATVTITVLQQELVIYNAISPNNDGVNDSFLIQGLENYPDNEVEIYNRWGTKVYAARSYNNTSVAFNGYSNVDRSLNQNEGLPSGTYFYIIKYTDNDGNSVNKTGYLYLN